MIAWVTDWTAAQARAKAEGKPIFLFLYAPD